MLWMEVLTVDELIAKQGELFPKSSEHHSSYALRHRHALIAEEAAKSRDDRPKNGGGKPVNDLTGQRFGHLAVIELLEERQHGSVVYLCECDCGTITKQSRERLKKTRYPITHCGCQGVGKAQKPKPGALSLGSRYSQLHAGGKNTSILTPLKSLYANYRYGAAKRGYEFGLTLNQFKALFEGDCHYCGVPPAQEYGRSDKLLLYNGIDRTDNDKGYTADNCVSCCSKCNYFKGTLSQDEFRQIITDIHEHWASVG
jgi:hypothetical protein